MDFITELRIKQVKESNNIPENSSLLATSRDPDRTTSRYAPIDHLAVIESLNRRNWFISYYTQVKPHKTSREGFVQWSAIYSNPDFSPLQAEAVPMIVHQGSHDGSKPLTISFAVRRLANQTTCIVGNKTVPDFVYKHIGTIPTVPQLDFEIEKALVTAEPIFTDINRMRSIKLSAEQLILLAGDCAYSRFDRDQYFVQLNQLIDINANSLWEQFNFIQDTLIQATWLKVQAMNKEKPRKAKAVKHIEASFKLRQSLWNTAVNHLQLAEQGRDLPAISFPLY